MKPLLLLLLSFTSLAALSQPAKLTIDFYNVAYHDGYLRTEASFNHRLLSVIYTNKKSGHLAAAYYRYNDSSFVYKGFDSAGHTLVEGLIQPFEQDNLTDTVQIPDMINDPDGSKGMMKDSVIREAIYLKHGIWKEYDTLSRYWEGNYLKSEKAGLWKHFKFTIHHPHSMMKCDSVYDYSSSKLSDNPLLLTQPQLFEKLKGEWFIDWFYSSRTHYLLTSAVTWPTHPWCNFSSVTSYTKQSTEEKLSGRWRYENNILILDDKHEQQRFRIEYLNKNELVLRRIL